MMFIRGNPQDLNSWKKAYKSLWMENGKLKRRITRLELVTTKVEQKLEKAKQPSLRILKKRAWNATSRLVRMTGAWKGPDGAWWNRCYTCDKERPITELQAGHIFHGKLDYDPRALRPQDTQCNLWKRGNLGEYRKRLLAEIGPDELAKLDADAHAPFKPTREFLIEVEKLYKLKFEMLGKEPMTSTTRRAG